VRDAVAVLIEHLATGAAAGDRQPRGPPLPLPRLRARRQLSEVRAADLGFSVEEAATFLGAGMGQRQEREQVAALVESLTERELEVLRLLAAGRSNAGIAVELFVEQSMVKTHLIYVYRKLGVHSRTQAVARARVLRLLG
jgi:ATP/maltotriose-dependent transcriptional regulator MalT